MRVAVVGVCGSGKSTIVDGLREQGIDAYDVAQEHSVIADLWRHQFPDFLVVLTVDLETVRERRGPEWPGWIFDLQIERLADARQHASIVVSNQDSPADATVRQIVEAINDQVPDEM